MAKPIAGYETGRWTANTTAKFFGFDPSPQDPWLAATYSVALPASLLFILIGLNAHLKLDQMMGQTC